MILRTWTGETNEANAPAYLAHIRQAVIPELEQLEGFHGVEVLRRRAEVRIEFLVMTWWTSMEAIRSFAGPDLEMAVVPPEAQAVLSRFDSQVKHYERAIKRPETD